MRKNTRKKQENIERVDEQSIETTAENSKTTDEVEAVIDELAAIPKRQRRWEIDFVRGLMILFVVWDHFMWDIRNTGGDYNSGLFQWLFALSGSYYGGALRNVTHDVFVTMFVLTSGISCSFSRNNFMRGLKMCAFAIAFTLITDVISGIMHGRFTIYFNVIHVVALSVLIYSGIEWIWSKCKHNWSKNVFGVVMFALIMTVLVLGYCAKYLIRLHQGYPYFEGTAAYKYHWINLLFGENEWITNTVVKFRSGGDYLSFLPDFGWFLVGAILGRVIYRERKSIFPSVNPKFVSPVTFVGRHSLWVYFISQIVMYGLIYLLHVMFPIL